MSASGPKTQLMSLLGVNRTSAGAVHMSAFDPKRTFPCVAFDVAFGGEADMGWYRTCPLLTQSGHYRPLPMAHFKSLRLPSRLGGCMRRRELITLLGGAVATWPLIAHTQQATKMPQIGVLSLGRGDKSDASLTALNAFMPALGELGYTEGRNI